VFGGSVFEEVHINSPFHNRAEHWLFPKRTKRELFMLQRNLEGENPGKPASLVWLGWVPSATSRGESVLWKWHSSTVAFLLQACKPCVIMGKNDTPSKIEGHSTKRTTGAPPSYQGQKRQWKKIVTAQWSTRRPRNAMYNSGIEKDNPSKPRNFEEWVDFANKKGQILIHALCPSYKTNIGCSQ
jgi:hypothetical protein